MSDLREIVALNARILDAEEQGKVDDLEPLLTESFFIVRSSGQKLDRAAFLADVPNQSHRGRRAEQPAVHQVGSCAIYTSIVTTTQNPDGAPNPGRFWNTRLFVQEDGQWHCAAWQVMKLCDE
jgi:hypothetical protein